MKIKTKLAISFCIIIFVPVVLTSIVLVGFNKIQLKAINKTYGMEDAGMLALTDTVQFLNKETGRTYDELEKTSLIEPSRLLDSDYLTKINKKLEKKYSYLIVKSEGELIFNGGIDNDDILRKLPRISNKQSSSDVSSYMDSDDKVLIKQLNFRDSDGDEASLYIVTSTACVIPEVRTVLIEGAFALVLILLTTAAMLIVWIYRSIITPIERLRIAAENIKDGNLDFELETSPSDGEIGELCTEAKNIRLSYENHVDSNVLIIADPEQIRRVINNIVGNSVKYMNKTQSYIDIRINDVGDFIQVEIEDNGRGIDQRDMPYIFDRFYRADASRNSATGGSGIGLSIVKKIIEDHGGKIWATSKEGDGTTMFFVIRKYQETQDMNRQ